PRVLRRDDGPRRRGDDALARLQLREGPRPGPFPEARQDPAAVPPTIGQSQTALEVQPIAAVLGVPPRVDRSGVYALGQPDLQPFRLATAVLLVERRLRVDVPGAARHDRLE